MATRKAHDAAAATLDIFPAHRPASTLDPMRGWNPLRVGEAVLCRGEPAELESTKEGRKVYVKKSGLFFLSSKQEALDLNAAKQDAAVAAAAAALDLADADPGES